MKYLNYRKEVTVEVLGYTSTLGPAVAAANALAQKDLEELWTTQGRELPVVPAKGSAEYTEDEEERQLESLMTSFPLRIVHVINDESVTLQGHVLHLASESNGSGAYVYGVARIDPL